MKEIFDKYQQAEYSVIPVNRKVPLLIEWNKKTSEEIADEIETLPPNTTGLGILLGQKYNRRLACIDVDTNDAEICERLIANFPLHVRCYGAKGFKAFFLTDGEQTKSQYKFNCPANSGFVEVFYENRQLVVPPSLHSDDLYYTWDDDACTLLTVGYDDLPIIPFAQIETIPTLINSPTVSVANKNLPASLQYSSDDVADGRYGVMIAHLGRLFKKYNNRPKFSAILTEMLDFDSIHCPKNSFFLYEYNKKRAEIKTNDRSINASAWIASVARTFLQNSGATFAEESEAIPTESISFNPFVPLEKRIEEEDHKEFDNNLIPPVWRSMILEMSEATSVRPYPIFMAFLAALGAACQSKTKIQPIVRDRFHQYPNLAVCLVANSGSKKSDILTLANEENRVINEEIKGANKGKKVEEEQRIQARIEGLYRKTKELSSKNEMDEAKVCQKEIAELQDQLTKLDLAHTEWMVEMSSIQKLILDGANNQNNGLYLELDEFKQIQAIIRKKGNEEARSFFMKGVDGNKGYSYSTLARGKDVIKSLKVSILTSIQPDVLNYHLQDLHNPKSVENDGFWQRFLFISFGDPVFKRSKSIDFSKYSNQYYVFRKAFFGKKGIIHLDPKAIDFYMDIRDDIRMRANPYDGSPAGSFLYKHEGLLCRFAYLYEFLSMEGKEYPRMISKESVDKANKLLLYIGQDLKNIFKVSQDALKYSDLERLIELIRNQVCKSGETINQWNNHWRLNGSKIASVYKMVDDLEMRGYLATIQNRSNGKIIIINPECLR